MSVNFGEGHFILGTFSFFPDAVEAVYVGLAVGMAVPAVSTPAVVPGVDVGEIAFVFTSNRKDQAIFFF